MVIRVKSFVTPPGNVAPVLLGTSFNAPFANTAEFTHDAGETCAPGAYRQYVKGQFIANGSPVVHHLCTSTNTVMSPTGFLEDGCPPGHGCTAYGHRDCPSNDFSNYTPDQPNGCKFAMKDAPGFSNVRSGVHYSMQLDFKADLIDTVSGADLATRQWTTNGSVTVPTLKTASAAAGLQEDDRIVGVRLTRNIKTNAPEVHVVVLRKPGQPALRPDAVGVSLKDAQGATVPTNAKPVVHEVGGRNSATASIVFTLREGSNLPATAEISGVTMRVKVSPR